MQSPIGIGQNTGVKNPPPKDFANFYGTGTNQAVNPLNNPPPKVAPTTPPPQPVEEKKPEEKKKTFNKLFGI